MFEFRKVSCSARNQVQGNKQTTSRGAVGRDFISGFERRGRARGRESQGEEEESEVREEKGDV
jgi:hypothetical protein